MPCCALPPPGHPTCLAVGLGGASSASHGTELQLCLSPAEPLPQSWHKRTWRAMAVGGRHWYSCHPARPPAPRPPEPVLASPLTCRGGWRGPSCLWLPSGGPDWPARLIPSFIGTLSSGAAATRPPPPARCLSCLAPLPACLPARLSPSPPALLWHKCPTTPPTPVPSLPASCHRDPNASVSPQRAVPPQGRCPPASGAGRAGCAAG